MRLNTLLPALCLISWLHGCATTPSRHAWENRLSGDNIVLLGEVHDNAEHHRLRLDVLRRAFDAGWRPSIAMEKVITDAQHLTGDLGGKASTSQMGDAVVQAL